MFEKGFSKLSILCSMIMAMMLTIGCADKMTFDNTTYNLIKSTEVTLKVAMKGFGDAYRSPLNDNNKYITKEDYDMAKEYAIAAMKAHNGLHTAYEDWKLAKEKLNYSAELLAQGKIDQSEYARRELEFRGMMTKVEAAKTLMETAIDIFMDFVDKKEAALPVEGN